jgi:hypothetical protein
MKRQQNYQYVWKYKSTLLEIVVHSSSAANGLRIIHTYHAAPLPFSDSVMSFVKVRVVAENIRTASPTV